MPDVHITIHEPAAGYRLVSNPRHNRYSPGIGTLHGLCVSLGTQWCGLIWRWDVNVGAPRCMMHARSTRGTSLAKRKVTFFYFPSLCRGTEAKSATWYIFVRYQEAFIIARVWRRRDTMVLKSRVSSPRSCPLNLGSSGLHCTGGSMSVYLRLADTPGRSHLI